MVTAHSSLTAAAAAEVAAAAAGRVESEPAIRQRTCSRLKGAISCSVSSQHLVCVTPIELRQHYSVYIFIQGSPPRCGWKRGKIITTGVAISMATAWGSTFLCFVIEKLDVKAWSRLHLSSGERCTHTHKSTVAVTMTGA